MANILAGQRAAFTKAFQGYQRTDDEPTRHAEAEKMARIILRAPDKGFTREDIVQEKSIPLEVEELVQRGLLAPLPDEVAEPDPDRQVAELNSTVDTRDLRELGSGAQAIYAYGYRCSPDRLKVGRTENDVIGRIASQIGTSTPDKPWLRLVIRTQNSRALEKALHGALQYRGKAVIGGGAEWFVTTPDEICSIYASIAGTAA